MIHPSHSHLVLIPSYNTGRKVLDTVREARTFWQPVWVVIDGSTDGTGESLQALAARDPGLKVIVKSGDNTLEPFKLSSKNLASLNISARAPIRD